MAADQEPIGSCCGPQDYAFLRLNAGICRRVVEEKKKPINIYVCILRYVLKFQTNVRMMRTRMDFFGKI